MPILARLILIAAAVLVYRRALDAYFYNDDFQWLVASWSFEPSRLVAFSHMTHFYRPVIDVYFATLTTLFGASAFPYHAVSVAIHAANALLVFALLHRASGQAMYGFLGALFFVVAPAGIDGVAWVGAVGEPLGTLFGCLSLIWFLKWHDTARSIWRGVSIAAFLLALLTHESSLVFLPLLTLADWAFVSRGTARAPVLPRVVEHLRQQAPYVVIALLYLAVDLAINRGNYLIREGHYAIGPHMFWNGLDYVVSLYVGRRDLVNYAAIVLVVSALLLKGNRRTVFATLWMLLALAPFVAFTWGNTSRYLYQPAIGISMLLAEGVSWLDRAFRTFLPARRRVVLTVALVAFIAGRFASFAVRNVAAFSEQTEIYRRHGAHLRKAHRNLPPHAEVTADPSLAAEVPYGFANALLQWEYQDPTIRLVPYE